VNWEINFQITDLQLIRLIQRKCTKKPSQASAQAQCIEKALKALKNSFNKNQYLGARAELLFLAYLNRDSKTIDSHFRRRLFSVEIDVFECSILENNHRRKCLFSGDLEEALSSFSDKANSLCLDFFEIKSMSGKLYQEKRVSKNQKKRQSQVAMHLYSMGFDNIQFYDVFVSESKIDIRKRELW